MRGKYPDYNIIPIGDHCAVSIVLKELNLRQKSYPFDWVMSDNALRNTNLIYNILTIGELSRTDNVDNLVKTYIGDAFYNVNKTNTFNKIVFPHDTESVTDIFEKYKRRFIRLKTDLNGKNIFILLTRFHYIEQHIFETLMEQLLSYNRDSIILFISGKNHKYFTHMNYRNVIFKQIEYDISKYYRYDYTTFRPNVKSYLSSIFEI